MSLSDEFIGDLMTQLEDADDNINCYDFARTIERAATIAAMRRCAEICYAQGREWDSDDVVTEKNYAAFCGYEIRAEIARLEAEK